MPVIGNFDFSGLVVNHAELNGKSVLTNGLEAVRKYNPVTSQLLPLVLRPFRGAITLADHAAGALDAGTYVYRIVPYNINEDEEGEAFPDEEDVAAFEITLPAGRQVRINRAGLTRDNAETTHWRIYRTIAGGSWPALARVATVLWATATYDDNVADDDLDQANEGLDVTIQVPMPKPFICTHGDRLFMWGDVPYSVGQVTLTNGDATVTPIGGAVFGFHLLGKQFHAGTDGRAYTIDSYDPATGTIELNAVYAGASGNSDYRICGDPDTLIWTEPGYEHKWPALNNAPVQSKENDKAAGVMSAFGHLVCAKSTRAYAFHFDNNPAIPYSRVSPLSRQYGTVSHRSMVSINNTPTFLSRTAVCQERNGVVSISNELGDYIKDNLLLDSNGTQQMACAVHLSRRGQYICFFPDKDAVNYGDADHPMYACNQAVVWHYLDNKFSIWKFDVPITCAEIGKDTDGEEVVILGDANGYVWEFPYGDLDGPPAGSTYSGTVTQYVDATPCAIVDDDAVFPTSGLGLAGMAVYIYEGTGAGQVALIDTNGSDMLILRDCFETPPDETSKYYIGSIRARYKTGWMDYGTVDREKKLDYAHLIFKQNDSELQFNVYEDFGATPVDLADKNPRTPVADRTDHGLVNMSGDDTDSEHPRGRKRIFLGGVRRTHVALELEDDRPNNPWTIYDLAVDVEMKEP
jgi:hypothetical protein